MLSTRADGAEVDNILREKEENMRVKSKIFSIFYFLADHQSSFLPSPVGLKLSGTLACEQALHSG